MRPSFRGLLVPAALAGGLMLPAPSTRAQSGSALDSETPAPAKIKTEPKVESIDLLDGMRSGALAVEAVGTGNSKMSVKVKNNSGRPLRIVLPTSLIARGAVGQFGGLGGGGLGGLGGMSGLGGMMGGPGGMGGMGGGMGGMGGGMDF